MKISSSRILNIILATMLLTSVFLVNATTNRSNVNATTTGSNVNATTSKSNVNATTIGTSATNNSLYDPWVDINGDGVIGTADLHALGVAWGATGDPTKNVNVTNWPACNTTTVWFRTPLNSTYLVSGTYDACGFGSLHILMDVACIPQTANATVSLYSTIWDASHTNCIAVNVWTMQFTGFNTRYDATTIPVPGEEFYFLAYTTPVLNNAQIYLSFNLTWS